MASSIAGAVIVKFLLTVQYGVFVKVAVIVYVPAAKVLMVIGPAFILVPEAIGFPNASTTLYVNGPA
ncbi:hypothetical protein D3C72_1267710 [compost metagenome]